MSDTVVVNENGQGRYQQSIQVGRHSLLADEPSTLGGDNAGPAPFDYVMAGLGACTSMTLRMYAERKGWSLDRIEVQLSHEQSLVDGIRCNQIHRQIGLHGELNSEQKQRLLEIANKCPVHRALSESFHLTSELAAAG
ncbi:MAG: OsmC family protein [Dechloromonas sp.]|nr:OsmC family protein [Dechloromonas sp.]